MSLATLNMASFFFHPQGDYMKSERLFKDVMSRILANGSVEQDDNKIIEMSLKLSQVYAIWGDHEKASAGFRFCVDTQERKVAAAGASVDEAGVNTNVN